MVRGALNACKAGGNAALGVYQDHQHSVTVEASFRTVFRRGKELPNYFPDFYNYLLSYPNGKPDSTSEFFYWGNIKFGLEPTFRVNHVIVRQQPGKRTQGLIASKQLYASHYFQMALDLWLCVVDTSAGQPGFYLLTMTGSRQEGLTGFKG